MQLSTLTDADLERQTRLRRMKAVALSLLGVAAVVYVATLRLDHAGAWGYVNTMAEAAMVGALADWFAVTALFRHPLGIPIPHTAIIPRKKDELAGSLQAFFVDNFLTEDVVRERIADAHLAAARALEDGAPGATYNIGRGEGSSVLDVLRVIGEVTGLDTTPEVVDRRPGDPARVVAKVDRIREGLGFTASHGLRSMVDSAWAGWQLRHP